MSAEAIFSARELSRVLKLKASHRQVLAELANCLNKHTGRCDPSIAYICEYTGLNKKTVMSAIQSLEECNVVSATKTFGARTKYKLHLEVKISAKNGSGIKSDVVPTTSTKYGTTTSTKSGTSPESNIGAKNGTPTCTKNGTPPVPKTVPEPINNLEVNLEDIYMGLTDQQIQIVKKTEIPPAIQPEIVVRIFEHRKTIKKQIFSEKALQPILKRLAEKPDRIHEAVETMEARQWQGFDWSWIDKTARPKTQHNGHFQSAEAFLNDID